MFTKLGTFLNEQPIRRPMRFVAASGEDFVVMRGRDYTLLTGIDSENLPMLDMSDTVTEGEQQIEHAKQGSHGQAAVLAHISLEDEMSVDDIPL